MDTRDDNIKCPPDEELSAYMDGDLEAPRQGEIENHLVSCGMCQQAVHEIGEIAAGLAALGSEKPPDFLWARIESTRPADGIRADRAEPWTARFQQWWEKWWRMPAAAVAVGAAAVYLIVTFSSTQVQNPPIPTDRPRIALHQEPSQEQVMILHTVIEAQKTYAEAIESLEQSFEKDKSKFSPQVQNTIAQSMADINKAIDNCRQIIDRDPKNIEAHRTVLAAYQQKVDLLTDLVVDPL